MSKVTITFEDGDLDAVTTPAQNMAIDVVEFLKKSRGKAEPDA